MANHKNKQEAFQAAQQGTEQVVDAYSLVEKDSADYGSQLKHVRQELNEAIQQIGNALEVASEHQRMQLMQYMDHLQGIMSEINAEG
ncbi:hypothetical protein [Peribacillus sp. SCS-155]|uniref:hypothetical protein n=1 Tax=Peribacillus sedimenti TaxID=3115297 RepID=UPI0039064240